MSASKSPMPAGVKPYDWALRLLRVSGAHRHMRGSKDVVVAVIDLGYRHHPDLEGHLWRNPRPAGGDIHGWDCADDDASLEYSGHDPDSVYHRGHHVFVAGEVAAVAPACPIMIVRVAYGKPDSWPKAIRWAVDHGARVLVIPHGYLQGEREYGVPLFYMGTDFAYPYDNPGIRETLDYAFDSGCLIVRGVADNRGRRVAAAMCAVDTVMAIGSANRRGEPADICDECDYVEVGAPAGDRHTSDDRDRIWGCGGDMNYIPFSGGCMAAGFAGGVAALAWSRFPDLTNLELRQLLRNTARPALGVSRDADGWEPKLGYGILDARRAVALPPERLCRDVRVLGRAVTLVRRRRGVFLQCTVANLGVFDARTMVVAYDGHPARPADPSGTLERPAKPLSVRQLGHTIVNVRGLWRRRIEIGLTQSASRGLWLETFCLDRHDQGRVHRLRVRPMSA